MRIWENGVIREATEEEQQLAAEANTAAQTEDIETRLAALQDELVAAKILLGLED